MPQFEADSSIDTATRPTEDPSRAERRSDLLPLAPGELHDLAECELGLASAFAGARDQDKAAAPGLDESVRDFGDRLPWLDLGSGEREAIEGLFSDVSMVKHFVARLRSGELAREAAPGELLSRLDEKGESISMMLSAVSRLCGEIREKLESLEPAIQEAKIREAERLAPRPEPIPEEKSDPAPAPPKPEPPKLREESNEIPLHAIDPNVVESVAREEIAKKHPQRKLALSRFWEALKRMFGMGNDSGEKNSQAPPKESPDQERRPPALVPSAPDQEKRPSLEPGSVAPGARADRETQLGPGSRYGGRRFAQTGAPEPEEREENGEEARSATERARIAHGRIADCGQMLSTDRNFLNSLGVTDVYVVAGRSGELLRLDRFIKLLNETSPSPDNPTYDDLFPKREVGAIERVCETPYGVRFDCVAQCRFKIKPGGVIALPLPIKHSVGGMIFLDAKGDTLEPEDKISIREGLFGSCLISPPPEAAEVIYTVREARRPPPAQELLDKIKRVLPVYPSYHDEEDRAFHQALEMMPRSDCATGALWYAHERRKGYVYSMNNLAIRYQESVGQGFDEAISGSRIGICDSFAYHLARGCVNLGVVAVNITGVMPRKDLRAFQFNPGHAQTALLTEDGPRVFDLTAHTEEATLSSWHFSGGERRKLMSKLSGEGVSNRTVHEVGAELGARLRGLRSFRDEDGPAALGMLGRYYSEQGERTGNVDDCALSFEQERKLAVVNAAAHQILLEARAGEAVAARDPEILYRFARERDLPTVSDEARRVVPENMKFVLEYDALRRVCEHSRSIVLDPEVSQEARERASRWLVDGLDPDSSIRIRAIGMDVRPARKHHCLEIPQAVAYLDAETIGAMGEDARYQCFVVLQAALSRWLDNRASSIDAPNLKKALASLELLADSLASRSMPLQQRAKLETQETLCAAAAKLSKLYPQQCEERDELRHSIARVFSKTDLLPGSEPCGAIWPLAASSKAPHRQGLAEILSAKQSLHFFDGERASQAANRAVAAALGRDLCDSLRPFGENSERIDSLRRAGFAPDLSPMRAEIVEKLFARVPERLSMSCDVVPNLPGQDRPASTLYLELAKIEASELHKTLLAVIEMGGAAPSDLDRVWPAREESEVAEHLSKHFHVRALAEGLSVCLKEHSPNEEIVCVMDLAESSAFSADLLVESYPSSAAAVGYLEQLGRFPDRAGSLLSRLKWTYPEPYNHMLAIANSGMGRSKIETTLTGALAAKLFEGMDHTAIYHALLCQAADNVGYGSGTRLKAFMEEVLSFTSAEVALTAAELERMEYRHFAGRSSVLARNLEVPLEHRIAALVLRGAGLDPKGCHIHHFPAALEKHTGMPEELYFRLLRSVQDDKRAPHAQVWGQVAWSASPSQKVYDQFRKIWKRSVERAGRALDSDTALRNAPFSRYMFDQVGKVLPLSQAGELDDLRDYVSGDDIRHVAWSASARRDKLIVKKMREEEVRPVKLVLDLEWLSDDLEALEDGSAPKLERVFTQILMAEKQGIDLDIALMTRARTHEFKRVVASADREGTQADSAYFRDYLLMSMAGCRKLQELEREIYQESPRPAYNILSGNDVLFERDTIAIFGVAEQNMRKTQVSVGGYQRSGVYVSVLKNLPAAKEVAAPAPPPEPAEPPRPAARRGSLRL